MTDRLSDRFARMHTGFLDRFSARVLHRLIEREELEEQIASEVDRRLGFGDATAARIGEQELGRCS